MRELLEDLLDYAVVEAERSIDVLLALLIAVGVASLYIKVEGLFLLPPAAAAAYFLGSMVYRFAKLYSRDEVRGLYSFTLLPAYALVSVIGFGVFEAALRPLVSAAAAGVMAAVLALRVYGGMRDYEVVA